MFSHRKISNLSVDEHWNKIKRTISREMCYSATEVIGEHAAEDMLEFADLNKH
ncbi:MAG: hypothetical protein QMC85_05975 [Methanocellales archaeon]|nr:hypothetical protein [Methanocellales archaeon]